ncbi:MAG: hypothetical protein DME87_05195 [Verrucomicrobia bacterium]|nr:MAG: hypothetical protein DME87_05195 [Verrucomicrobiota bacterium]
MQMAESLNGMMRSTAPRESRIQISPERKHAPVVASISLLLTVGDQLPRKFALLYLFAHSSKL